MKKRLNLQLFADGDGAGTGTGTDGTGTNTGNGDGGKAKETNTASEKKYSDEDLDKIIGQKFAKWQKDQDKAVKEAERLAGMNAQEKAEHERDTLQKQLDEYKRKDALAEMTKTARKMISDAGISASDDILAVLVSDNADATKKAVDSYVKAFKDAVEHAVKERLRGEPPKAGTSAKAVTKEQILNIKNPAERQRLIKENMSLFQ